MSLSRFGLQTEVGRIEFSWRDSFPSRGNSASLGSGLDLQRLQPAYALLFAVVLPSLSSVWLSPRIAAAVKEHWPCADSKPASGRFHEPSLVLLAGTQTLLTGTEGAVRASSWSCLRFGADSSAKRCRVSNRP